MKLQESARLSSSHTLHRVRLNCLSQEWARPQGDQRQTHSTALCSLEAALGAWLRSHNCRREWGGGFLLLLTCGVMADTPLFPCLQEEAIA